MIKFCSSQLPSLFKSIKIAIDSEEDDIPTTDISHLFGESDSEDDDLTKNFLGKVTSKLSIMLGSMLGLTGPGDVDGPTERVSKIIKTLGRTDTTNLDEVHQRRFDNAKYYVLHKIGEDAVDNGNLNLFEVCNRLAERGKNPFSYSDVKLVIQGMLNR